jgi:Helix-turn-helix domain
MKGRFARIPLRAFGPDILTPQALRVLGVIAAHLGRDGWAYPSLSTIAELTGIVRHKVPYLITEIEDAGLLHRDRTKGGRGNPTRYQIVFEEPETVPPQRNVFPRNSTLPGERLEPETVPYRVSKQYPPRGPEQKERKERTDSERVRESWFMEFRRSYPSRAPHPDPEAPACREFEAALKRGVDPAAIIRGAENYARYVAEHVREARFVAKAETWLREDRWNDHQEMAPPPRRRLGMGMF